MGVATVDVRKSKLERLVGPNRATRMMGAYEAASRLERDLAGWQPQLMSPNVEVETDKPVLDARARDLLRNEGTFRSLVSLHQNQVVGARFRFVSSPRLDVLGLQDDEVWAEEFRQELETKFSLWAESLEAYPDARGHMTLTEIVRQAVAIELLSGEYLMAFNWLSDRERNGSPYRTVVLPIELDRLQTPPEHAMDDRVRQGVRVNRNGKPIGFYIWRRHPRELGFTHAAGGREWRYYRTHLPWGRRKILYLRNSVRPEQIRGITELAAALRETKLLKDFRLIALQNAIVSASFAAVIESDMPPEVALAALGAQPAGGGGDAYVSAAQQYLEAVGRYVRGSRHLTVDGVRIPHLFPGSKLNIQPAGRVGGADPEFPRHLLHHIAAVGGVSYEELTRDFENTNYSSARAAMLLTYQSLQARRRFVAERVAAAILRAWFEEAAQLPPAEGGLETMQSRRVPSIYDGMNMDAFIAGRWLGAPQGHIDPLKEAQATALMVEAGLLTMEDAQAQMGRDWRDVMQQLKREQDVRERLGLTVSSGAQTAVEPQTDDMEMMDDEQGADE